MAFDSTRILNEAINLSSDKTFNESLFARIIKAEKSLGLDSILSYEELAKKAVDVHAKYIEFYHNISFEPLYTKDDDPEALEQVRAIGRLLDSRTKDNALFAKTLKLTDIRVQTLGPALHEDPNIIDVLRYFTGQGEITFELLASAWLHKEHHFAGLVRYHSIEAIKRLVRKNIDAANCVATHAIQDYKVRPVLEILTILNDQQKATLVDLLSEYQLVGHFSKKSGHKAEMIIAKHLSDMNIPFQPKNKLTTLGSPDIEIPSLGRGRLFDLVIPDKTSPKVIIECAYYNSNVGSVASKVVREVRSTLNSIKAAKDEATRGIKLVGFVDGAGWIAMSGHLIKMLLLLDDFVQLNTIEKLRKYA